MYYYLLWFCYLQRQYCLRKYFYTTYSVNIFFFCLLLQYRLLLLTIIICQYNFYSAFLTVSILFFTVWAIHALFRVMHRPTVVLLVMPKLPACSANIYCANIAINSTKIIIYVCYVNSVALVFKVLSGLLQDSCKGCLQC